MPGAPYNLNIGTEIPLQTFGFEQITVDNTANGIGLNLDDSAVSALVTVETGPVRYRVDKGIPTASVGMLLNIGDRVIVWGKADLGNIRFIRSSGVSATLDVEYHR